MSGAWTRPSLSLRPTSPRPIGCSAPPPRHPKFPQQPRLRLRGRGPLGQGHPAFSGRPTSPKPNGYSAQTTLSQRQPASASLRPSPIAVTTIKPSGRTKADAGIDDLRRTALRPLPVVSRSQWRIGAPRRSSARSGRWREGRWAAKETGHRTSSRHETLEAGCCHWLTFSAKGTLRQASSLRSTWTARPRGLRMTCMEVVGMREYVPGDDEPTDFDGDHDYPAQTEKDIAAGPTSRSSAIPNGVSTWRGSKARPSWRYFAGLMTTGQSSEPKGTLRLNPGRSSRSGKICAI